VLTAYLIKKLPICKYATVLYFHFFTTIGPDRRKMEVRRWKIEVGRWKLEDGR
jgi:hypothetical protein